MPPGTGAAHRPPDEGAAARTLAGTPREPAGRLVRRCSSCRAATPRPGDPPPGPPRRVGETPQRESARGLAGGPQGVDLDALPATAPYPPGAEPVRARHRH